MALLPARSPARLRRIARALLVVGLLAAALALGPAAAPAEAAPVGDEENCPGSRTLRGSLQGEDGRFVWGMLGIEFFDANGRVICPMANGYSAMVRVNENQLSGHGAPASSGGYTKNWSVGVPSNAVSAWIEAYPYTNETEGVPKVSKVRYGHAMRRAVHLSGGTTTVDLRLPLNCGVQGDDGSIGNSGSIGGRFVTHGTPGGASNIFGWNVDPDTSSSIMGWGISEPYERGNGYYRMPSLEPNQHYSVWILGSDGQTRRSPPLWVEPCKETVWNVVEGNEVPFIDWYLGFMDTRASAFYARPLAWLKGENLTNGVGNTGMYMPTAPSTRAEVVTFLWRAAGRPTPGGPHGFVDVPANTYYENALRWAKRTGLTTGVGGSNRFDPDGQVSRAELVTFLWRLDDTPTGHPDPGFVDVGNAFYTAATRWAAAESITTGVGGSNRFEPTRAVTRGEIATFIWRAQDTPAPRNPGDAVACTSFSGWSEANAWYQVFSPYHGDVAKLRTNGTVCPNLPGAPLR